jgi:hypothetical protein
MMCSIVCLQMRLPNRAGVFLYLARPAMNDSRRMEKGQDLSQTSMHVPGGFVAGRLVASCPSMNQAHGYAHTHGHAHAHTWSRSCSYTPTAMPPRLHAHTARRGRAANAWREARNGG